MELSYLPEAEQAALPEVMESEDRTPSHAQAIKMRTFSEQGKLNPDMILSIMQEEKPNRWSNSKFPGNGLTSFQAGENGTFPLTVGPIAPQAPTAEDSPNQSEGSEKFCISCTPIEKWLNLYKLHGAKGLLSRNLVGRQKGFDGEFRLKVLQYKQEHHLSCT